VTYHEVDFPTNTSKKISAIQTNSSLGALIDDYTVSSEGSRLISKGYNIHPLDLRTLEADGNDGESVLDLENLSARVPTLVLSECCLIYLPPSMADAVLHRITRPFLDHKTAVSLILYEPIHPNDSFGRVMISNLATRGIILQTLKKYGSRTRQRQRLKAAGFGSGQAAADVDFIWNTWITEDEKERVGQVEMLDEVEEWRLLSQHYCVAWGWYENDANGQQGLFHRAWANIEGQLEDDEMM
jgi:[phosphatase 2A protein]-leucine-carboxy methyltransferase